MKRDLTEGSVFGNIARFSLPFLMANFLQLLYGLVDMYVIGRFCGTECTTAVSIGSQIMHMVTVMVIGLSMGSSVIVGQRTGARDSEGKLLAVGNSVVVFGILGIVLAVILLFARTGIVELIKTPAEARSETVRYLVVCFGGIPFIVAYNVIASILRGSGDSKSPFVFVAVACAVNVILDFVFVGKLGMESMGAALGTVCAQAFSSLSAIVVIWKKKIFGGISARNFVLEWKLIGKIFRIGVPIMAQDGFIQVAFIMITVFANRRGLNDAAAVGVVEKLIGILFLVPSSLLSSVSTLCAQNFGAGKADRAKKTLRDSILIVVGFGLVFAVAFQFCSAGAVRIFRSESEVVALGESYMKSYVWDCLFAGIHFVFSGYFCAMGRSEISFIHNVISILTARVPLSYLASVKFADTLYPMGWAAPIGSAISVVVCVIFYVALQKRTPRISDECKE